MARGRTILSDDLRILVLAENPGTVVAELDRRFPGLAVSVAESYDGLADAARIDPHVAYTERFELKRFPREALFCQPSLGFVHASGAGINHLVPWGPRNSRCLQRRRCSG